MFACLDTTAKWLGLALPAAQLVWVRFLTHTVLASIVLGLWRHPSAFLPKRPALQILRGLFLLSATGFNFYAVRDLRLDQTTAIFFLAPFLVTALAGPFLDEWAGPRRWAAIAVGFLGALLILRPGPTGFQPAMILSVASFISYAFYVLLTRKLAPNESHRSMILIPAVVALVAATPFGIAAWEMPQSVLQWFLLGCTGIFGGLGHWFLIKAHEHTSAPTLAPFLYTQIVWMVALGYVVFGDVPDVTTLAGAAIIVASGLYLLYREQRAARRS